MLPVIYQLSGILPDGKYLPGQYQWAGARQLISVLASGQRPAVGTLKLYLEIGGVLTDFYLEVPAGTTRFTCARNLMVTVPARTAVRWLAVFDGDPASSASQVSLTMTIAPAGSYANPQLTVRDGDTGLVFYTYDPATHQFTNVVPTGMTTNWTIAQDGDSSLVIQVNALNQVVVSGGIFFTRQFIALGGVQTLVTPRAVFYVGNVAVGTLTATGLLVADGFEVAAPALALSPLDAEFYQRFEFWSAGALTAVLEGSGLSGLSLAEATNP